MVGSETDRQWFLRRGRNRTALQLAEMNQSGGVSPRISPMAGEHPPYSDLPCPRAPTCPSSSNPHHHLDPTLLLFSPTSDPRDASNLLQRAGFTLLTVDVEDITISYPSMWELIEDLRDMGESGAVLGRRPFIKRDILIAAESIYKGERGTRLVDRSIESIVVRLEGGGGYQY